MIEFMSKLLMMLLALAMGTGWGIAAELKELSFDARELRTAFDGARDQIRLLMVFSPT